ncbi:DUF6264 family protein [Canibacter zhoujuaniae]|uniref:DUF6264 family protein n=1 Tax=Canibacter zhoujuaniae TaxID=2708343 RepID=UPI00141E649F|nr:DUF6264 family protein [Canibacter zhoujuaniae]
MSEDNKTNEQQPDSNAAEPTMRPKPQFGELAPEGWQWEPAQETQESETAAADRSTAARVPHNLGLRYDHTIPLNSAPVSTETAAAKPAAKATAVSETRNVSAGASGSPVTKPLAHPADRVITFILLGFAVFGAMISASSLYQLPKTFNLFLLAAESELVSPPWVQTLGFIGAATIFVIFAATVLLTFRRQRQGKIAFWIPLVGGAIASVVAFAITGIAMVNVIPAELIADPSVTQRFLEQLQSP